MAITVDNIKELREMTSCGVIECKNALEEAGGDFDKAKKILQKRGLEIAAKKGSREAKEGRIETYIHQGNKVGVILEVNCETDFVAKNEDFVALTKDIAMQIVAANPKYIKKEDIPEEDLAEQKDPNAFIKESCLLEQPFIKDPKKSVKTLITDLIASIGENIYVSRFTKYKVNEIA